MGNQNVLRSSQEHGPASGHVPLMAGIHTDACGACHLGKTRDHLMGGVLFQREKLRPGWGAKLDWVSCNIDWALLVCQSIFLDYTHMPVIDPESGMARRPSSPPLRGASLRFGKRQTTAPQHISALRD